jgi:2-polyprenyl-3-methyl-5-hydroxy-6-metoxy-1,4-benzoquinol methylase
MIDAEPRDIEWTDEQIRTFWDYHSRNPALTDQYFSGMMGRSLLRYTARRIRIGTAVDVGCGRGQLIQFLMQRGSDVYGADQSPESVKLVCAQFADLVRFQGAAVGTEALPGEIADTVFMVEVIEHLGDKVLQSALDEAHRLLKPGGHLVLTTPNKENLEASKIICPNCLTVFHQMQHVRSWSADTLAAKVGQHGFQCRSAEGVVLTTYDGILDTLYRWLYLLRHSGNRPSLIYIGAKKGGTAGAGRK